MRVDMKDGYFEFLIVFVNAAWGLIRGFDFVRGFDWGFDYYFIRGFDFIRFYYFIGRFVQYSNLLGDSIYSVFC
jgi:hypothetical protein